MMAPALCPRMFFLADVCRSHHRDPLSKGLIGIRIGQSTKPEAIDWVLDSADPVLQ